MKQYLKLLLLIYFPFLIYSCGSSLSDFDATGSFEADEIIISAEQSGKILELSIEEGQLLDSNSIIGQIDVSGLAIQKEQAQASVYAIREKMADARPQVDVLQSQIAAQQAQIQAIYQQLEVLQKEVARTEKLVAADAATKKQLDDLNGQEAVLQKQITVAKEQEQVLRQQIRSAVASVSIQNRGILSEVVPGKKRTELIEDQIKKGQIINLYPGTVLTKYAMAGEYASIGKPLYKLADLSTITLRTYISGNQLPLVKLNQAVKVFTDDGNGAFNETTGTITWISPKAEFTPKTIQTKDERANLVYAIKVKVRNDGSYKIGMYGEIKF
ncbi:HlyD family secretion protein [Flavihumibacter sp. UBA7668]|uniref:HlyD family secretion protein n=1 Tax=Flavihumibacter sp. UBA7668 TaxID=1946542 RepID=UPI0025B9D101|nr:HlyD family efflux transporter periplasmic adaptor subunit [Flavihumibacter sp. UBA7668]